MMVKGDHHALNVSSPRFIRRLNEALSEGLLSRIGSLSPFTPARS